MKIGKIHRPRKEKSRIPADLIWKLREIGWSEDCLKAYLEGYIERVHQRC